MTSPDLQAFIEWFLAFESYVPAIMLTIGAGLLIVCSIGAIRCPRKDKDECFHRHVS